MKIVQIEFTDSEWDAIEVAAKYYNGWQETVKDEVGKDIANTVTGEELFIKEMNKHFNFYLQSHKQALIAAEANNQPIKVEGKEKK